MKETWRSEPSPGVGCRQCWGKSTAHLTIFEYEGDDAKPMVGLQIDCVGCGLHVESDIVPGNRVRAFGAMLAWAREEVARHGNKDR